MPIRGACAQLEQFLICASAQRRNCSQTCDSSAPAFPSLRLQVQHEWFLNCCPHETYTPRPLSNRLKNSFNRGRQKMHLSNLGFTTRFMHPTYMSPCASQTLKGAIVKYIRYKKDGTRKSCCPSLNPLIKFTCYF